jgi:hypothetical protein
MEEMVGGIPRLVLRRAGERVTEELKTSWEKHNHRYTDDPLRRAALVCEEAGEALQAALDLTREVTGLPADEYAALRGHQVRMLRQELVEAAAAAMRALSMMEIENGLLIGQAAAHTEEMHG